MVFDEYAGKLSSNHVLSDRRVLGAPKDENPGGIYGYNSGLVAIGDMIVMGSSAKDFLEPSVRLPIRS